MPVLKILNLEHKKTIEWYIAFKQNASCVVCGCKHGLDLHHIFPKRDKLGRSSKWDSVYAMVRDNMPLGDVIDEANKTVPLCRKHHQNYHKNLGY